ncbi:hypothetical protein D3C87_1064460 [compost metagenome]
MLDGDEQPDGERHAGEDAAEADRRCDIGWQRQQVGQFDMRRHGHAEGQQGDDSDHPGNERQAHGLTDAAQVNADDHHEQGDLHRPATDAENRFGVGTNERRRRAGADGQGQRASHADQITHERPEGTLRIHEHAASAGQRRGQFRHAQGQAAAEQGHQQRGDQHVQPATGRQPEVPAGKLPGHHQRNSKAGNLWPAQRTFLKHRSLPRPEGRFIVLVRNGGGSASLRAHWRGLFRYYAGDAARHVCVHAMWLVVGARFDTIPVVSGAGDVECAGPIAGKLAPTRVFSEHKICVRRKIQCRSEPARDNVVSVTISAGYAGVFAANPALSREAC